MAFDFKKEYRDLYQAKTKPMRVEVPAMTFAPRAGCGRPQRGGRRIRAGACIALWVLLHREDGEDGFLAA